jgi:serine/threonine-protein kinase RsbW
MGFISKFRNADGSETDIDLALHEALANAVVHGNGKNPDKRVYVVCRCDLDGEVLITIRDQGLGFDSGSIPDPTNPETLMSTHGRGIYFMRVLLNEKVVPWSVCARSPAPLLPSEHVLEKADECIGL